MDKRDADRFPLEIPTFSPPPSRGPTYWAFAIMAGGGFALIVIYTLGMLSHISNQIDAAVYDRQNWTRIDQAQWCARAARANDDFVCPTAYPPEMFGDVPVD